MNRRAFLSTVATAGAGLVVGNAALDAWDRLTWKRRFFPGWSPRSSDVIRHLTGITLYRQTETGWELVDLVNDAVAAGIALACGPPRGRLPIGQLQVHTSAATYTLTDSPVRAASVSVGMRPQ